MKTALFALMLLAPLAAAQEKPGEMIDPNTKTQGGADPRGSGAAAGARGDDKLERDNPRVDRETGEKDKPVAERKPREQERDTEEPAAKGGSAKPQ
jgi:hypothetical protein